jgi:hypothetical protein
MSTNYNYSLSHILQLKVPINPDFAFGCNHKCFMHLKVALSIALIVVMELFLNRSVKNLNIAALKDR